MNTLVGLVLSFLFALAVLAVVLKKGVTLSTNGLRYLSALFFYAMLALGAYLHWWPPTFLETALESGLVALGVFHSVNYGAMNLTASSLPAPQAPTEPTATTSTQGATHATQTL